MPGDSAHPSPNPSPNSTPRLRERLAETELSCSGCGYNLRGAGGPYCPECGAVIAMPVAAGPPAPISDRAQERLLSYLRDHDVRCTRCGYNLRGSAGEKCPECGAPSVLSLIPQPTTGPRLPADAGRTDWRRARTILTTSTVLVVVISVLLASSATSPAGRAWTPRFNVALLPAAVAAASLIAWWACRAPLQRRSLLSLWSWGLFATTLPWLFVAIAALL